MMSHSLYNLRTTPTGFAIAKFDADLNLEASYELRPTEGKFGQSVVPGTFECSCPAALRPSCKHRKMLPIFLHAEAIDTNRFYDYERQTWHQPVVAYGEPEAPKEELERVEGAVHPRQHAQSLAGAIECGAITIIDEASPVPKEMYEKAAEPQPTIIRRRI